MKISVLPFFLEFIRPFALAHGTRTGTQLAFVKIDFGGIIAFGEASLPPYQAESFSSVQKWVLSKTQHVAEILVENPCKNPENIPFSAENPAASAALQSAILNWHAASTGKSLSDFFEKSNANPNLTLTITKSDVGFLDEKLRLEKNFTHFKLKLTGAADDLDFVKGIRAKTDLPFCIDINQGYQSKETAIQLISDLEKLHCVLIEQPLKKDNHEGHFWLKQRTPVPIIADESIGLFEDLLQFHEAYSGANIKLMKCGGLFQAQKMLDFIADQNTNKAEESRFLKLIGCMSESSLGVSAAAILAPHCQMADLDAPYLNQNDPFEGFKIQDKKIELQPTIKLKEKFATHFSS